MKIRYVNNPASTISFKYTSINAFPECMIICNGSRVTLLKQELLPGYDDLKLFNSHFRPIVVISHSGTPIIEILDPTGNLYV